MPTAPQPVEHLLRLVVVAVDRVRGDPAVVGDRAQRGLRHGVDHAGRDQVDRRSGCRGRRGPSPRSRPTAAAAAGPRPRQRLPPRSRRTPARSAGRPAGRWRSRPAPRSAAASGVPILSSRGSTSVSTRETKNEATDAIRGQVVAGLAGALQAVEEGVHDLVVAGQGEDQRDVDADALGQAGGDRRDALPGGRDLDEQVGPVDQPPQRPGLGDRRLGVVGQPRVDLDRHPPVHPVGAPRRPAAARRRPSARRRWSARAAPRRRRRRGRPGRAAAAS